MEERVQRIAKNLKTVEDRIAAAARQSNRAASEIRLVVVTKTQPVEVVEDVLKAGAKILGENYPEETLPKLLALKHRYAGEWHMIGHLQSRKAGIVAEHFDMFQSLDRLELAEKIQVRAAGSGRSLPVLMEFNVSGEESKAGWQAVDEANWPLLVSDVKKIVAMANLEVRGLMTMPPLTDEPDRVRPFFARLRRLRDFFQAEIPGLHLFELSMGTSGDYEAAVLEGATLVRIGTAILGPRLLH
jgi:pyridoxal phosphate enzyme (YggS family)